MDIQQLRSWIFELYEPLREERTYIVLRGSSGLLVDLPPFDRRALLAIRGVCNPRLVFFTHSGRAGDVERWRDALPGLQVAAHEADADAIPGGVDLRVSDGYLLLPAPETRVIHIGAHTAGASMLLVKVPGGALLAGDGVLVDERGALRLPPEPYATAEKVRDGIEKLRRHEFSSLLSTGGGPLWNAAKERYLELLEELPRPQKRFGHLVDAPWDREYLRVRAQMSASPLVPTTGTIQEAAAHGPSTLITAWERGRPREVRWDGAPPSAKPGAVPAAEGKRWSLAREAATGLPPSPSVPAAQESWELGACPVAFRRLSAGELAEIARIDWTFRSFDLSADGRDCVFAWDKTGSFEIYRAPIAGDAIYQLTSGAQRSVGPRLRPDGGAVAFLRDTDGDERFDIWLVDRDGARERKLTDHPATRRELAWSPDGSRLAYVSDEDGSRALQVMDLATRRSRAVARELLAIEDLAHEPSWSPDGRFLAYHAASASADVDVHIVAADGSRPPERMDTRRGAGGQSRSGRFSPDGGRLAFATDLRGRWEVGVLPLRDGRADGDARFLRQGRHDEYEPQWDAEPRRLLYQRNADAQVSLRRVFLVSLDDEPALDAPGVHWTARPRPDGGLAYLWSGPREPLDVYLKEPQGVLPRRITRSLPPSIPSGLFVEPRHVRYESRDGTSIPALLYLPHREAVGGSGPLPAVVYAHGGPTAQHFAWFEDWPQWFANHGYAVLAPNVRGSTGYGRAFREAHRGDLGGKDLDDLVAGADWLERAGLADPERIGVFGTSYGGYLALLALARAPRRFAAGGDLGGPTSLRTFLGETRPDLAAAARLYVDGLDDAALRERSPAELADRIVAPVLVLHGARDPRVPVGEARRLVEALRERGRAFSFHAYESGHLLVRRGDRRDAYERAIEFFDEHVNQRASAPEAAPA